MNEAKPGARLAGRYRLTDRLALSPDESTWRAVDSTLDRQVTVWILRPGHPFADEVLDTARRVALIDDRRLIKVLDVGTDSGTQGDRAYVVNEFVEGETLESLAAGKPLTDAAARRVAGETAEGLTAAAGRGLHHLKLNPRLITVTPKGVVKIGGLAVLAAASGLDPGHATRANRSDATGIVGLLYYGLTGRWPGGDVDFPPAPRTAAGDPVPPGELVPGVPDDLNTLCTQALGSGTDGPQKPAEIALDLTPWSSAAQADLMPAAKPAVFTTATPASPITSADPAPPAARAASAAGVEQAQSGPPTATGPGAVDPATDGPLPIRPVKPQVPAKTTAAAAPSTPAAGASSTPAAPGRAAAPPPAAPEPEPPTSAPASAPIAASATAPGSTRPDRPPGGHQPPAGRAPDRAGDSRFRPSPPVMPPPMPTPGSPRGTGSQPLRPGLGPIPLPPAGSAAPAGPATSPAAGPAGSPAASPAAPAARAEPSARRPTPGRRPTDTQPIGVGRSRPGANGHNGTSWKGTPPHGVAKSNGQNNQNGQNTKNGQRVNGGRPAAQNAVPSTGEQLLPWATTWSPSTEAPSALESTGPFPLVLPQEAPPAKQSRQVLLAVVGVLAVVVVLAAFSLRGLLGGDEISPGSAAATGPSLTDPTGTTAPATSAPASAVVAPEIAAIRAIDPQGDGDENTSDSPKAVDGDNSTSWASQTYNSASFGGLKKGVGLAIRLKQRTVVSSVTVRVNGSGGRLQLRLGPNSDPVQAVVADSQAITGDTITLTPTRTTKARYVILWFTELPRTDAGYTAEVVEVRVK